MENVVAFIIVFPQIKPLTKLEKLHIIIRFFMTYYCVLKVEPLKVATELKPYEHL